MSHPTDMVSSFAFEAFVGVDIAAKTFTVAIALGQGKPKPKLEKQPFEQSAEGFTRFLGRLAASEITPDHQLIVMEATGPYWGFWQKSGQGLPSQGKSVKVVRFDNLSQNL